MRHAAAHSVSRSINESEPSVNTASQLRRINDDITSARRKKYKIVATCDRERCEPLQTFENQNWPFASLHAAPEHTDHIEVVAVAQHARLFVKLVADLLRRLLRHQRYRSVTCLQAALLSTCTDSGLFTTTGTPRKRASHKPR